MFAAGIFLVCFMSFPLWFLLSCLSLYGHPILQRLDKYSSLRPDVFFFSSWYDFILEAWDSVGPHISRMLRSQDQHWVIFQGTGSLTPFIISFILPHSPRYKFHEGRVYASFPPTPKSPAQCQAHSEWALNLYRLIILLIYSNPVRTLRSWPLSKHAEWMTRACEHLGQQGGHDQKEE